MNRLILPATEPSQTVLLDALMRAHYASCFRENGSTMAVANAAAASGDLAKAIAAGLLTLGGKHAPIEATVRFLAQERPREQVAPMLEKGEKVPGWGGTFQKWDHDPIWIAVDKCIHADWPELAAKLDAVTEELCSHGKLIYPNPSAYTACVAIIMGIPPKLAPTLFIRGRINGWCEIAAKYLGD